MSDPITLYRYLDSDAALKTMEQAALRVGRPGNFNDPFEWRFGMTGIDHDLAEQIIDGFASDVNSNAQGILCFSGSISDPVLWSLYAEKHRGVAFEVKHSWPEDHLHKMNYLPERPVLDVNRLRKCRDQKALDEYLLLILRSLMTRKSLGWSFECEYRLFIDLNDSKYCRFSEGHYYWRVPAKILTRVILGFRCPLKEADVRKLLDEKGFGGTQITRAEMCVETYSIRC